jgi:DNA gyrase/topoisomerase IV subunit B
MRQNYTNDSIKTLSGLEHLKFRAQMYGFSGFGKAGILLMCKEILDNAMDEASQDPSIAHVIDITFIRKKNTFQCIVQDTGRGVPLKKIKAVFTNVNTSGKWVSAYGASIGANGIGAKGAVALSTSFAAVSKRPEGMAHIVTKMAKCVNDKVVASGGSTNSGTIVFFEPDFGIMKNAKTFFDPDGGYDDFINLLKFASVTIPNAVFNLYTADTPINTEAFTNCTPAGLWTLLQPNRTLVLSPDKELDYVGYTVNTMNYRNYVRWDSGVRSRHRIKVPVTVQTGLLRKEYTEMGYDVQVVLLDEMFGRNNAQQTLGAVNRVPINDRKSSHITVMHQMLKLQLYPFIAEEKYRDFFMKFYQLPFILVVLVQYQHAVFINQDKSCYVDDDFAAGFSRALAEDFAALGQERWSELYSLIEKDIQLKWSRKNKRDLGLASEVRNLAFSLHNPRCYYECKETGPGTELLICEGVSSGDYVKQLRDPNTQAVFELKGKLLNAFKKGEGDLAQLRKNHVVSDLLQVLGTSPEDTELEHFRFERIGILSDADPTNQSTIA